MTKTTIAVLATLGISAGVMICVLDSCSTAENATLQADFQTACSDWNGAKTLVELATSPVPYADTIEGYVSDACDVGSALSKAVTPETVQWLQTSTNNLRDAVDKASHPVVSK